jgi:hypothetical protein
VPAIDQTIAALTAFEPTGIEDHDVERLDNMLDTVVTLEHIEAIAPALLGVFERFPHALLGSPGPLVHCIERLPIATFLPLVLDSFRKRPARMTFWMIDRCLRETLPAELRLSVLGTLRSVRRGPDEGLHDEIDELLAGSA